MNTNENWSLCRIVCWGLSIVGGIAIMIGMSPVIGLFLGILFGLATILGLGLLAQRLICIHEPDEAATVLEMTQAALEKAKEATGVTPPSVVAKARQAAEVAPQATEPEAPKPVPAAEPTAKITPDFDGDGIQEGTDEGRKPQVLSGPKDGQADDLKQIKGVGPKLEQMLQSIGFYHFTQIASWTEEEVAWVDANLKGFKGRVSRDNWVEQAKVLATGGETEFSKRVEDGDVY